MPTKVPSTLAEVLAGVAQQMLADLETSRQAAHRPSKGTVRESSFLSRYLEKYIPRTVEVAHSGELLSWTGRTSRQCDVLVLDRKTPPLYVEDDYRIVPAECVLGVVEVKSSLGLNGLDEAWANIVEAKRVQVDAFGGSSPVLNGMIFAYEAGTDLRRLGTRFKELAAEHEQRECVDGLFALDAGYITWITPGNHVPSWKADGGIAGIGVAEADPAAVLMAMTLQLDAAFSNPSTPLFYPGRYWGSALLGSFIEKWFEEASDDSSGPTSEPPVE